MSLVRLDVEAIGRRAARQRETLRMEQEEVAQKAGMSRAYISRLENGGVRNPKVSDLASVAEALGISLDALIWGRVTDTELPAILRQKYGPQMGELITVLETSAANLEKGDLDTAIYVVRSLLERRGRAERMEQ